MCDSSSKHSGHRRKPPNELTLERCKVCDAFYGVRRGLPVWVPIRGFVLKSGAFFVNSPAFCGWNGKQTAAALASVAGCCIAWMTCSFVWHFSRGSVDAEIYWLSERSLGRAPGLGVFSGRCKTNHAPLIWRFSIMLYEFLIGTILLFLLIGKLTAHNSLATKLSKSYASLIPWQWIIWNQSFLCISWFLEGDSAQRSVEHPVN